VSVQNGVGCTSEKSFTILVEDCNDAPIAINDINNTTVGIAVNGNVLTNDFDPNNGDNITVNTTPVTTPNNGTLTSLSGNGDYTYTPNPGFVGTDSFTYVICDDGTPGPLCDTALVVINVIDNTPVTNDPPVANNDAYITNVNVPINGNMIANDFDPDGDNIMVNTTIINGPLNGTAIIFGNGTFAYTPTTDFVGDDEFTYVICDDGTPSLCDTATVYITVLPNTNGTDNDPPVAVDDAGATNINTILNGSILTINDFDPNGDNFTVNTTPASGTSNGTVIIDTDGSYIYTPDNNYVGPDQFTYTICDDGTPSLCDTATVYLVVFANNEPPVAINDVNSGIIDEPVSGNTLINDIDPD
jgi:hypothetical protein